MTATCVVSMTYRLVESLCCLSEMNVTSSTLLQNKRNASFEYVLYLVQIQLNTLDLQPYGTAREAILILIL